MHPDGSALHTLVSASDGLCSLRPAFWSRDSDQLLFKRGRMVPASSTSGRSTSTGRSSTRSRTLRPSTAGAGIPSVARPAGRAIAARPAGPDDRDDTSSQPAPRRRTMRSTPEAIAMTRFSTLRPWFSSPLSASAGCAQAGNKAGGPAEPVVLRMATVNGEAGYNPAVTDLLELVAARSNGNVQHRDGRSGLASSNLMRSSRSFAGLRTAASTSEWSAPASLTRSASPASRRSTPQCSSTATSSRRSCSRATSPRECSVRLISSTFRGWACWPTDCASQSRSRSPLLGPDDWRGIGFGVYRSELLSSALRALGAEPVEAIGPGVTRPWRDTRSTGSR